MSDEPVTPDLDDLAVNAPSKLAGEVVRPWAWSLRSWGLVVLGPIIAGAVLWARPEPVATPIRTMGAVSFAQSLGQQTRDGRNVVQGLTVEPLREGGHRLTGERLIRQGRRDEGTYQPFEIITPAEGIVWNEPGAEPRRRGLFRSTRSVPEANGGQPMDLPAYLNLAEADYRTTLSNDPRLTWAAWLGAGLAVGMTLAGVRRLIVGPTKDGPLLGELAKVDNPDAQAESRAEREAREQRERERAAELDAYVESAAMQSGDVAGDALAESAEPASIGAAATPAKRFVATTPEDKPTHVDEPEEDREYAGEFYPTVVGKKHADD
ncbi:MAG: hypothetical protein AAGI46_00150 [Planctomycetota bacterium]